MTFVQFCELHGLIMDKGLIEGRWVRVRTEDKRGKRNGAYKFLGDHGFVQNHATMLEVATWRAEGTSQARPIDQARLQAQRDRERAERKQAMRSARDFWSRARPLNRPHPYIERKGLTPLGCAGLRQHDGLLVVPVVFGDWIISLQTITAEGAKKFWFQAPVRGGCFELKRPGAALTVFAEGLATGLAIYQSVRRASVVVTFNTGNLLPVIQRLKPSGSVCIAADNDWGTQAKRGFNPGIQAATNAAELIGCGVAYPEGIEGSDWADFLAEAGPGGARQMERLIQGKAQYVDSGAPMT